MSDTLHGLRAAPAGPAAGAGTLDIVWDRWGEPHVFAASDEDAYFGLGYACAHDRFFQMSLGRLTIRGRLAEFFGRDFAPGDGARLTHDRRMRLLGYARLARTLVAALDVQTRRLLDAYAAGVNAYIQPPSGPPPALHPNFAAFGIPIEPWSAADCVLTWIRVARTFTPLEPGHLAELLHRYEACIAGGGSDCLEQLFPEIVIDEQAAVVQSSDPLRVDEVAAAAWLAAQAVPRKSFARVQYYAGPMAHPGEDALLHFRFSQGFAVAGNGAGRPACLVGDPKLIVRVPSLFWGAQMRGASFDVRGVTVPGSPNFVVGSTGRVSWTATGLGLAQADLFRLLLDPQDPERYMLEPQGSVAMESEVEVIHVLGGASETVHYRESHWGPVVTPSPADTQLRATLLVPDARNGEGYSVRWVPFVHPGLDPHGGFRALYQAQDAAQFRERLAGWSWPGVNCVFADASGTVGYSVTGALPLRSPDSPAGGALAQDGTEPRFDWVALVPPEFLPWVLKPPQPDRPPFVYSANHLPIGSWYPIPLVRFGGHNARSRRLKERLDALPLNTDPELHVRPVQRDGVWIVGRDFARLGKHLRDVQAYPGFGPGEPAGQALAVLESWSDPAGNGGRLLAVGDDLAGASFLALQTGLVPFRPVSMGGVVPDVLIARFGSGDSGLQAFLRTYRAAIAAAPGAPLEPDVADFVHLSLDRAWLRATGLDPDPANWATRYRNEQTFGSLPAYSDLEGYPPLGPPTPVGPLDVTFGLTLFAQLGQSHTQWTVLHAPDQVVSQSLLPLGQSELPTSVHFQSQRSLWEVHLGELQAFKGEPLTLAAIQALPGPGQVTSVTLPSPP